MSTVLKALEELERHQPGATRRLPPSPGNGRRRWPFLLGAAVAVALAIFALRSWPSSSSPPAAVPETAPAASVAFVPDPPAVAGAQQQGRERPASSLPPEDPQDAAAAPSRPPEVSEVAEEEPPRGQIVRRRAPQRAPQQHVAARAPRKPAARRSVEEPAPLPDLAIPREPAPAAPAAARSKHDPGQMGVALRSIAYSADANERTATIDIAGTGPVTLREGQAAAGVEVQLILSDVVYIYRDGIVVGLSPKR